MTEKGKNAFSAGEVLETIFQDQDSHDEQFDFRSDVEMVEDSEESEQDSYLDSHIVQMITNQKLEDEEHRSFQQEAIASPHMFLAKNKRMISLWQHF